MKTSTCECGHHAADHGDRALAVCLGGNLDPFGYNTCECNGYKEAP